MIKQWLDNLVFTASNDDIDARRKHPRRSSDSAIAMIDGQNFVVENWSEGGLLLSGDTKMFGQNQNISPTLKFKLNDKIVEIEQDGQIVRKGTNRFAVQFAPLTQMASRTFKKVIEDAVTREFAESQMA